MFTLEMGEKRKETSAYAIVDYYYDNSRYMMCLFVFYL